LWIWKHWTPKVFLILMMNPWSSYGREITYALWQSSESKMSFFCVITVAVAVVVVVWFGVDFILSLQSSHSISTRRADERGKSLWSIGKGRRLGLVRQILYMDVCMVTEPCYSALRAIRPCFRTIVHRDSTYRYWTDDTGDPGIELTTPIRRKSTVGDQPWDGDVQPGIRVQSIQPVRGRTARIHGEQCI
jgi:hypothetical protein